MTSETRDRTSIRLRVVAVAVLASALLSSCALFEDDSGGVKVRSNGRAVSIENDTGDRIYYNIFGVELATLIDWIPHLDEAQSVADGKSRSISYADIMTEDAETEAIVYWWRAEEREGERVPGSINTAIVDL